MQVTLTPLQIGNPSRRMQVPDQSLRLKSLTLQAGLGAVSGKHMQASAKLWWQVRPNLSGNLKNKNHTRGKTNSP